MFCVHPLNVCTEVWSCWQTSACMYNMVHCNISLCSVFLYSMSARRREAVDKQVHVCTTWSSVILVYVLCSSIQWISAQRREAVDKQVHVCTEASACMYRGKCMYVQRQVHVCTEASECMYRGKWMYVQR